MVFAALGTRRTVSLKIFYNIFYDLIVKAKATAVVQVFHAHPDPSRWTEFKTGVACIVKDNVRKSYYIRLLERNVCSVVYA